jgi:hypothetical protein
VLNQTANGHFNREATETGSALTGDVPEAARLRPATVQAVQIDTGLVVARRNDVYVRSGWTTHVWLMPQPSR